MLNNKIVICLFIGLVAFAIYCQGYAVGDADLDSQSENLVGDFFKRVINKRDDCVPRGGSCYRRTCCDNRICRTRQYRCY